MTLPDITGACYQVTVYNTGAAPYGADNTVWSKQVCSDDYGTSSGAVSYIGTCDASAGDNTVSLVLTSVSSTSGELDDGSDFQNPCRAPLGCTQVRPCRENADVEVVFDLTVLRNAQQGFFDISVNFDDLFCSAKIDCANDLLFDGDTRGDTAVVALACTAGPGTDTHLYLSDLYLVCGPDGARRQVLALDPSGTPGNQVLPANAPAGLFGYAVYRDNEDLPGVRKAFWNAALGVAPRFFDDPALADCSLVAWGTAHDGALTTPFAVGGDGVYPYVSFDVPLDPAGIGALSCEQRPLDGAAPGVTTAYTAADGVDSVCFNNELSVDWVAGTTTTRRVPTTCDLVPATGGGETNQAPVAFDNAPDIAFASAVASTDLRALLSTGGDLAYISDDRFQFYDYTGGSIMAAFTALFAVDAAVAFELDNDSGSLAFTGTVASFYDGGYYGEVTFRDTASWPSCYDDCIWTMSRLAAAVEMTQTGLAGEDVVLAAPAPTTLDPDGDVLAYTDRWQVQRPDLGGDSEGWLTVATGGDRYTVRGNDLRTLFATPIRFVREADDGRGGRVTTTSNALSLPKLNSAPNAGQVVCSDDEYVVPVNGSLPLTSCVIEGYADADGDAAVMTLTTDCADPEGFYFGNDGSLWGYVPGSATGTCTLTIGFTDSNGAPAVGGTATIEIITAATLANLSALPATLDEACTLTTPFLIEVTQGQAHPFSVESTTTTVNQVSVAPTVSYPSASSIGVAVSHTIAPNPGRYSVEGVVLSDAGARIDFAATHAATYAYTTPTDPPLDALDDLRQSGVQHVTIDTSPELCGDKQCVGTRAVLTSNRSRCANNTAGELMCWGDNKEGDNGSGTQTTEEFMNPAYVLMTGTDQNNVAARLTNVVAVESEDDNGFALFANGEAVAWGRHGLGTAGNGNRNSQMLLNPQYVLESGTNQGANHLGNIKAIAPGYYHTCFLLGTGEVKCSGNGYYGQVGDGTSDYYGNPRFVLRSGSNQAVDRLNNVVGITSGQEFSCALLATSEVMCWGNGSEGQRGDGLTTDTAAHPVYVLRSGSDQSANRLTGAVAIAGGASGACALLDTSEVVCWGAGSSGWLGNGNFSGNHANPVYVLASGSDQGRNHLTGAVALDSSGRTSCVIRENATMQCWGQNPGNNNWGNVANPVFVKLPNGQNADSITAMAVGGVGTCITRYDGTSSGSLMCWGSFWNGDGTTNGASTPTWVLNSGTSTAPANRFYAQARDCHSVGIE